MAYPSSLQIRSTPKRRAGARSSRSLRSSLTEACCSPSEALKPGIGRDIYSQAEQPGFIAPVPGGRAAKAEATLTYSISSIQAEPGRFGSGEAVRRLEDDALLAGRGQFVDDISPAGQCHLVFLRSPYPHARILSVDTQAAQAMPGVLLLLTGADLLAAGVKPLPGSIGFKRADGSRSATPARLALAHERVRFVGEPVAAVVASSLQQARDAAEAIQVDYEELPMVVDVMKATAPGAPAKFSFVAKDTGRFEVELHPATQIAQLDVVP